jgi:N-methylhydantoinase B
MNPIDLKLFFGRITSICDEMGLVLRRTSFSPNIKDRLDFSCALFDERGSLCAQAAHIPVHLGSMAYTMRDLVSFRAWQPGDVLALNDPDRGGTHLPDVTVVCPVFVNNIVLVGFVANRAHHADIGSISPGSMPLSQKLDEEGVLIVPTLLYRNGQLQRELKEPLRSLVFDKENSFETFCGDFSAQIGANQLGVQRFSQLITEHGETKFKLAVEALNDYGDRIASSTFNSFPNCLVTYSDWLDNDGINDSKVSIILKLEIKGDSNNKTISLDFSESANAVGGNLNCPAAVVAAASYYCLRCYMPEIAPACEGLFRRIHINVRPGSILNPPPNAAVAAGNVETSQRLVDTIFGAFAKILPERTPAASQGTMNNISIGSFAEGKLWDYYETVAGGIGASSKLSGLDAVHSHMTNTLNTPIETLETHFPLRVKRYEIRTGSGGSGLLMGGNGVRREYEFLEPAHLTILSDRRLFSPWGLRGGMPGARGVNSLNNKQIAGKVSVSVGVGDSLLVETPGGGGWGSPE